MKLSPTFNPRQFEQRNFVPDWFTSEQKEAVDLTTARVSANLDWVSQLLGWAPSPNYWSTLRNTVDQGRQLLGGTFGVYNSFVVADVLSVQNWDNTLTVSPVPNLKVGTVAYLGLSSYTVVSLVDNGDSQTLSFGELTEQFLSDLSSNLPLRFDVKENRPTPFYRPEVEASGDVSFLVEVSGSELTLYPAWDNQKTTPYKVNILIEGATYYFDKPVYLSYSTPFNEDVSCFCLNERQLWSLTVPPSLDLSQTAKVAYLVCPYSDPSSQTNSSLQVGVARWEDPSDWNSEGVLKNFIGAWGNKGGPLPFNLAFDSLDIHGFDEAKSLLLEKVERSLSFDSLLQRVYEQTTYVSSTEPSAPKPWDTWWNTESGVLATYYPSNGESCSEWVEVEYRELPVPESDLRPFVTFPTLSDFQSGQSDVPVGVPVLISDLSGLSSADNVLDLKDPLTGPGFAYLQKTSEGYWQTLKFEYWNVAEFEVDALLLPFDVPVYLYDATGLLPSAGSYVVPNLPFSVQTNLQVVLTKKYRNNQWVLSPDFLLKYIANTSLFAGQTTPVEGELTWDWTNPDPWGRAAAAWTGNNWTEVTSASFTSAPSRVFDPGVVRVLCDGNLLQDGVAYQSDDYSFSYTFNSSTGNLDFTYTPFTFKGTVVLPKVVIMDSLTSAFKYDTSSEVFSGLRWYMSPNAYDAETTLRLWKVDDLQAVGKVSHIAEDNYYNPLIADQNLGPGQENWERFFVRLPPSYGRNGTQWDKANLVCQDFSYWGSSPVPEFMECPPEESLPVIYEEAFLYRQRLGNFQYIYSEPFLYSQIDFGYWGIVEDYSNSGTFPATDFLYDEWEEGRLETYEPLHCRQADTSLPVGQGYGNWKGTYTSTTECEELTGFWVNDVVQGVLDPIEPPVWDASIYKFPPTCESNPESYSADSNHYKVCYSYFAADLSAAEDGFFDPLQEVAWRFPVNLPRTGYLLPRS